MSVSAISIRNLSFSYQQQQGNCFSNLNLEIGEGERFGLFGPNGAGKTTLMNCMTGLLQPQSGTIELLGIPVLKHRGSVNHLFGLVPQEFSFYQELSPLENLEFFGAWYGLRRNEIKERATMLLKILSLDLVKNKQVQQFSGGMKRRMNLAIGVFHKPQILFLDEPTVGVDVETRQAIISYLKELNNMGTTLIYTSHQLSEAEELCDRAALIDAGKIIVHGSLSALLLQHKEAQLEGLYLKLTGKKYEGL
ncbi:MAG: ABC transporter ATP-binding protein [Chitinophagaceae bacterium]|nr:ABC transporter ATP-binding protein [Chitinophagaceae bacterium]